MKARLRKKHLARFERALRGVDAPDVRVPLTLQRHVDARLDAVFTDWDSLVDPYNWQGWIARALTRQHAFPRVFRARWRQMAHGIVRCEQFGENQEGPLGTVRRVGLDPVKLLPQATVRVKLTATGTWILRALITEIIYPQRPRGPSAPYMTTVDVRLGSDPVTVFSSAPVLLPFLGIGAPIALRAGSAGMSSLVFEVTNHSPVPVVIQFLACVNEIPMGRDSEWDKQLGTWRIQL